MRQICNERCSRPTPRLDGTARQKNKMTQTHTRTSFSLVGASIQLTLNVKIKIRKRCKTWSDTRLSQCLKTPFTLWRDCPPNTKQNTRSRRVQLDGREKIAAVHPTIDCDLSERPGVHIPRRPPPPPLSLRPSFTSSCILHPLYMGATKTRPFCPVRKALAWFRRASGRHGRAPIYRRHGWPQSKPPPPPPTGNQFADDEPSLEYTFRWGVSATRGGG